MSTKVTRIGGREFRWGVRTYVMGIINVTPDSFSGDGLAGRRPEEALEEALRFEAEGADMLDVGAESTRPGHTPITVEEELARLLPVLDLIASRVKLPVSVDTFKASVAERALDAGACMVNDQWALTADANMAGLVARRQVPVVLMHNQRGTDYRDLLPDVIASLRESAGLAMAAGAPREHIIVDPGIGFGKTAVQNLVVLRRLEELRALGYPVMVGTSRKSTIGLVLGLPVNERLEGTAATIALSIAHGADIVRVHDVKAMARVARMSDAIVRGWSRASP
ncbi:MAG: dihydropteroate synthase [Chloroflexota bacterium]|nr:dihydropteroate synthase [Chloroflexota bacterium]